MPNFGEAVLLLKGEALSKMEIFCDILRCMGGRNPSEEAMTTPRWMKRKLATMHTGPAALLSLLQSDP